MKSITLLCVLFIITLVNGAVHHRGRREEGGDANINEQTKKTSESIEKAILAGGEALKKLSDAMMKQGQAMVEAANSPLNRATQWVANGLASLGRKRRDVGIENLFTYENTDY